MVLVCIPAPTAPFCDSQHTTLEETVDARDIPAESPVRTHTRNRSGSGSSTPGRSSWPRVEAPTSPPLHYPPGLSLNVVCPAPTYKSYGFVKEYGSLSSSAPKSVRNLPDDAALERARRKSWTEDCTGEDSSMTAARRALWDDLPSSNDLQLDTSVSSRALVPVSLDDPESDLDSETDEPVVLPPVPSPSSPSHATLVPLASCLRSSKSDASSDTNSTSTSIRFSEEPPIEAVTYSPEDYKRQGRPPVEKLTVREVVELRSVKEAVGVWSGKVSKWTEDFDKPKDPLLSPTSNSSCALAAMVGVSVLGGGPLARQQPL